MGLGQNIHDIGKFLKILKVAQLHGFCLKNSVKRTNVKIASVKSSVSMTAIVCNNNLIP